MALALLNAHPLRTLYMQDDVPPFADEVAFDIIRSELGRPLEEIFSSISERPIAAASIGQVCGLGAMQPGVGAITKGRRSAEEHSLRSAWSAPY